MERGCPERGQSLSGIPAWHSMRQRQPGLQKLCCGFPGGKEGQQRGHCFRCLSSALLTRVSFLPVDGKAQAGGSLGLQKLSGCKGDSREQEQGMEDAGKKCLGRTQFPSSATCSWRRRDSEAGKTGGDSGRGVVGVSGLDPRL